MIVNNRRRGSISGLVQPILLFWRRVIGIIPNVAGIATLGYPVTYEPRLTVTTPYNAVANVQDGARATLTITVTPPPLP
jgi:hypothetical protein